jgi:Endoplasmic Reticulum Oxidoreductin 1 (ERO1)
LLLAKLQLLHQHMLTHYCCAHAVCTPSHQAIKIILASESDEEVQALSRNEVIALVNTAAQLAKSVGSVPHWKALELQQYAKKVAKYSAAAVSALLALVYLLKRAFAARRKRLQRVTGTTTTTVSEIVVVPAAAVNGNGNGSSGSTTTTAATSTRPKEE